MGRHEHGRWVGRGKEIVRLFRSSRHEGLAGLGAREDASVQRIARLGAGEVTLVLAGDDAVLVDTLGGAADNGLEVLAEVAGLEFGVEFGGEVVTEIAGVVGVVVAADAPGVLVLGEVAGDELDGVEGVCLTRLSGCKNSAADRFFGDLFPS